MALYPSLEDMKVHHIQVSQEQVQAYPVAAPRTNPPPYVLHNTEVQAPQTSDQINVKVAYPDLSEYMGIPVTVEQSQPIVQVQANPVMPVVQQSHNAIVAPISGQFSGLAKANLHHGIRQVNFVKNKDEKIGVKLQDANKGVFVCFVLKNSPAAIGGVHFGDQILQVDGQNVAGLSGKKAMDLLKKGNPNCTSLIIRDRPFCRTNTLHKDHDGNVGFTFSNGKIKNIVKESSAARNGLLINQNILEVDGQCVVGLKDKEIKKLLKQAPPAFTLTIVPEEVYEQMSKNLSCGLKKKMDHSIPEIYWQSKISIKN